jgi:hypothetical protein
MGVSELSGISHGTSNLIIGAIIVLTLIVIYILAKYLLSDNPGKNLDD